MDDVTFFTLVLIIIIQMIFALVKEDKPSRKRKKFYHGKRPSSPKPNIKPVPTKRWEK